jgi:hypothetical protein
MTVGTPAEQPTSDGTGDLASVAYGVRRALAAPRFVAALTLIAAGAGWAVARGLQFYGLTPAQVVYDFDQPPLLLALVGAWLLYRSRRR